LTNNDYGIYFYSSSNNNGINGNNITANNLCGILLDRSSNNNISGNNITANNLYGIKIASSSNNLLRNNRMENNKYSFIIDGANLSHFANDIDISNIVNGKPIYYLLNRQDLMINPSTFPNVGYLGLVDSTNITIEDLSLSKNGQGLLLAYTTDSTINRNNVTDNYFGIYLWSSSNNIIYHNNFLNNSQQAFVQSGYTNMWNDSYTSGGNYWSNYVGVDVKRGPSQDLLGSDGIGDIPYIINANNRDYYPLKKTYAGPSDIGITSVMPSQTVVGPSNTVNIYIEIINYGINVVTFGVTAYANTTVIGTLSSINLASRNSTTTTLIWYTTGFVKGNYTISAVADSVPGEVDTSDNLFVDGWVFMLSLGHDVAVRNVVPRTVFGGRHTSPFNVTAMSVGGYQETFNVTVYANETYVGSQVITLDSGELKVITFIWNISAFARGHYTLSAYAWPVTDETDTTDNRYTDGIVTISKLGDLNLDGIVNYLDASLFRQAYIGEYEFLADLNHDGIINYKDSSLFRNCYMAG